MTDPRPGDRLPDAPALDPIHVLLVEDDEMLCIAIAGYLRTAGIEVTSAPDAETAAARLSDGLRVDVLLTDLHLPTHSGLWLAEWCAGPCPGLPVLLMSAAIPASGVVFPKQVRRFLRKPFDLTALMDAVTGAAGR